MTQARKAFIVEIDHLTCVVFATSAAKAKWIAVRSYWAAGFGRRDLWPRPRAARQPGYDRCELASRAERCWDEDEVRLAMRLATRR
jgi:hypothetical protein